MHKILPFFCPNFCNVLEVIVENGTQLKLIRVDKEDSGIS